MSGSMEQVVTITMGASMAALVVAFITWQWLPLSPLPALAAAVALPVVLAGAVCSELISHRWRARRR